MGGSSIGPGKSKTLAQLGVAEELPYQFGTLEDGSMNGTGARVRGSGHGIGFLEAMAILMMTLLIVRTSPWIAPADKAMYIYIYIYIYT